MDRLDMFNVFHLFHSSFIHSAGSFQYQLSLWLYSPSAEFCTASQGRFYKGSQCLPRDASAERGNATVSRPSVCLSVRPSGCL